MKNHRILTVATTGVALAASFLIPLRAGLIPGVPDLVIDPAAIAKLADQIVQMQTMISNQVALYNQVMTQYNMLKKNLEFFTSKNAWKAYGVSLLNSTVTNRYGETVGWNAGVNSGGPAAAAAWTVASLPIRSGDFLGREILGNSSHLASLAGVEVLDSAGPTAMATLAAVRQQQTTNAAAINHLESTALSGAPDDNTEIKQLNLLNAAQLQSMRMQQGTAALHAELLQQVLISNMQQRNLHTSSLNNFTQTLTYVQTEKTGTGNVGAALMTYEPK